MPSAFSRLRIAVLVSSISYVSGLMRSNVTEAPKALRMTESTMTIAIRIRNITTGCGTMLPTFSTPSRNLCINVLESELAVAMPVLLIDSTCPTGRVR
ncbi:hypothetical protein D3C76_1563650 [compost metagenome]